MHIAAWGWDKRTNTQQMLVMLISGCREPQGSGGTTLSFMASRGKAVHGRLQAPASTAGCTYGLQIAGQEGKAINISLLHLGGSQMMDSCHESETLSTLTVTQEDFKQQLHTANVKNSVVWVSCISIFKKK